VIGAALRKGRSPGDHQRLLQFLVRGEFHRVYGKGGGKNTIGAGELSLTPMLPVMANAIYDAAGARMTQLPTTPVRIKVALARV